jgi:hypothetical protein
LAVAARGAHEHDLGAQGGGCFALDGGSVVGHDDNRLHAERAGGVGYSLRVIAAGVGDDAAFAVGFREGSDFVVGSAEFKGADGLLIFGFEEKAAGRVGRESPHVSQRRRDMGHPKVEFDEAGAGCDALEAGASFLDVGEQDCMHVLSIYAFSFPVATIVIAVVKGTQ